MHNDSKKTSEILIDVDRYATYEELRTSTADNDGCGTRVYTTDLEVRKDGLVSVDEANRLVLPPGVIEGFGIEPGVRLRFVEHENRLEIYPSIHSLAKLYIEPTSRCNLSCQTCIRNTWEEPMGDMDIGLFNKIIDQISNFPALRTVMLGGFGEPTFHKDIVYMIAQLKSVGMNVEMTSNGTLLSEEMMIGLIQSGLDTLWISFDGTSVESFNDIRSGAHFEALVQRLCRFKALNVQSSHKVKVGIAFVVLKKNIHELKNLPRLAHRIGAVRIAISNVLPYSEDMLEQMVCDRVVGGVHTSPHEIKLPLINLDEDSIGPLAELLRSSNNISIMGYRMPVLSDSCRFIRERCTFIRWDGIVSPCMGLLHSYKTYFPADKLEREIKNYSVGDLKEKRLKDIWDCREYRDFRDSVDSFDYSPCLYCGHCNMSQTNEEDCYGNNLPSCGGCLWAQGVIQCP